MHNTRKARTIKVMTQIQIPHEDHYFEVPWYINTKPSFILLNLTQQTLYSIEVVQSRFSTTTLLLLSY